MTEFRYMHGAVYIFENCKAQRVKVGMSTSKVADRLNDVNDMWLQRKVTCQICGGRVVNSLGSVPAHIGNGRNCLGGNALPIEKDVALAVSHLENTRNSLRELHGSEKGSATRIVNTLEKRIEKYRNYTRPVGNWKFSLAFYTECAEQVELLSHEILKESLDEQATFGEVFCCTVPVATEAVEQALGQLGLLDSVSKETQFRR